MNMNYLSTFEAAKKWGITPTRVLMLIKNGRLPNAVRLGSRWMIPKDTEKPADGRTKNNKHPRKSKDEFFRFPMLSGKDESAYYPPLSNEEVRLKKLIDRFFACKFEDAELLLGDLHRTAKNRYVRIYALYGACMIYMMNGKSDELLEAYSMLCEEMKEDFPHKKEFEHLIPNINATLGTGTYYLRDFRIDYNYPYHESFLSQLAVLSVTELYFAISNGEKPLNMNAYEYLCVTCDNTGNYIDSVSVHIYMGAIYATLLKIDEMCYHYRKALQIAYEQKIYYQVALEYFYYAKSIDAVISEFPTEFKEKIQSLSADINNRYVRISELFSKNKILNRFVSEDYIFIFSAIQGHSNEEIAKILRKTQSYVAKRYSIIYAKAGVKSKSGLVKYYKNSIHTSLLVNHE